MKEKGFAYNSCEKCGEDKDTEMYNITMTVEMIHGGLPIRLCNKCVRELKSDLHTFINNWLKEEHEN